MKLSPLAMIGGALGLIAAAGTAWAVLAEVRVPWQPRAHVRLIGLRVCDRERQRIWAKQDYREDKRDRAQERKEWQRVLEEKKKLRVLKVDEIRLEIECKRYELK